MKSKPTPDWVSTASWFVAGIWATGSFWYFLSSANKVGAIGSALGAALFAGIAITLHIRNDRFNAVRLKAAPPLRMLSFVWTYPLMGENEASWAVKESAALMGNLGGARESPGLGVAIVTTELALRAFGDAAYSRIDRCIAWAVSRAEQSPPFRMRVEIREPINYEVEELRTDFRHTLAFGVILARTNRLPSYLEAHVRLVLQDQCPDGGWPSGGASTSSPVFTTIYGLELLHLAEANLALPEELRNGIPPARTRGIRHLMANRETTGLWSTSALRAYSWDPLLATAWVLHRLAGTAGLQIEGWRYCLDDALARMIGLALAPQTWATVPEAERYRVEARVAAAAHRACEIGQFSNRSCEAAGLYLSSWKDRAVNWVNGLPTDEIDVGTAAFLVDALVPDSRLSELGRLVISSSST
jgi:hypothetical protein